MTLNIALGNLMVMMKSTGTWGMFIDDFPPELWDKMINYLESEDSWVLEETVEMSLDDDDNNVYKEYYP